MSPVKGMHARAALAPGANRCGSKRTVESATIGCAAQLVLPLALVLLQGCATRPAVPAPAAPSAAAASAEKQQAKTGPSIAPQVQGEFDQAMALVRAGQDEQAIEAFKKLAAALPDNAIPAINLALLYKKLDKPELAEAQLKTALAIEPDNPVANNETALLYRKTGRFAEARAVYEKTLARYPDFAMAHKNLGILCDLYLKDYQCAIDHYAAYAQSAPNDKSLAIWIADLEKRTGVKARP